MANNIPTKSFEKRVVVDGLDKEKYPDEKSKQSVEKKILDNVKFHEMGYETSCYINGDTFVFSRLVVNVDHKERVYIWTQVHPESIIVPVNA